MKNKHFRTLSAILIALAMVFTMNMSVFAAQDTVGDATIEVKGDGATVTIPKTIIVTNPQEILVYGPTINYDFSVAPVDPAAGATVKSDAEAPEREEGDYATAVVQKGVVDGVAVTTKPSFTSAETAAATGPKGVELTSNLVLTIDLSKFEKAGVYRYKVSDTTTDDALTAAGITRESGYSKERYLDVYIYNDGNQLKIGGYTLLKTNQKEVTGDNDIESKSAGFVSGSEKDATTGKVSKKGDQPTDLYNTINAELEKEVTGGLGDKTFPFSFAIDISNNNGMTYYTTTETSETAQGTSGTAASVSQTLKHGDKFFIKGLNPKATVKYTETNGTTDTYEVTIQDKNADTVNGVENKETAANATQTTDDQNVSNYESCNTQSIAPSVYAKIKFINNLDQVSPTNVVVRYAPYLLILAAGCLLLLLGKRRKSEAK